MIEKAKSIQKNPDLWRDTGFAGLLPNLPGWEARNIDENIESLKSQVAMQMLSAMKELSANGASGLGNASNREYQGLQSSLASLSTRQSPAQFRRSLQRIIDHAETAKNRLGTSFKQSYPDFQHQEAQTSMHLSDDELVNKYLGGR